MARYRTGGTPWTVIIDRKGVVRYNDFHANADTATQWVSTLLKEPGLSSKGTTRSSTDQETDAASKNTDPDAKRSSGQDPPSNLKTHSDSKKKSLPKAQISPKTFLSPKTEILESTN